jgi:hypothetical protein
MSLNGNGSVKAAMVVACASIIVALGGNATVYLDGRASRSGIREDRNARISSENQFYRSQCHRDEVFSAVIVQALEDAKRRAKASIPQGPDQDRAIAAIQRSIDQLTFIAGACAASIPPQPPTK